MANTLNTMTVTPSKAPGVYQESSLNLTLARSANATELYWSTSHEPTIAQILARDEFNQPFIVVHDNGQGRVTFDGGFPKFYNTYWNNATTRNDMPINFKYLANVVDFIKDPNRPNKVLIFSNSQANEYYTADPNPQVQSWTSFNIGMPSALQVVGYQTVNKTPAHFGAVDVFNPVTIPYNELTQYCAVVFLASKGSSEYPMIDEQTVENFVAYQRSGGGVFIITDHDVFQRAANMLANRFGADFYGVVDRTPSNPVYNVGNIIAANGQHPIWANIPTDQSLLAGGSEGAINATSDPLYQGETITLPLGFNKLHVLVKSNTGVLERTEFDYLVAGALDLDFNVQPRTQRPHITPVVQATRWQTSGRISKGLSPKARMSISGSNVAITPLVDQPANIRLAPGNNTFNVSFDQPVYNETFNVERRTYDVHPLKLAELFDRASELESVAVNQKSPAKALQHLSNVAELSLGSPTGTAQNLFKYFTPQPLVQNEALVVDCERDLAELIGKKYRIRSFGYGVNQSNLPWPIGTLGLWDVAKNKIIAHASRSYTVVHFDNFGEWQARNFDIFGNFTQTSIYTGKTITSAAAMAEYLKYINDNFPGNAVIVFTHDEPFNNRLNDGIHEQLYRMGASPAVFESPSFMYRSCYVLLGGANIGQGKGAEFLTGTRTNYPSGDPNAIMEVNFHIRNGLPVISGTAVADYQDVISSDPISIDSVAAGITPPSFQTIFNSWARFDREHYFAPGETTSQLGTPLASTEANSWTYDQTNDRVICTVNSVGVTGFISNEKLNWYKHAVTVSSTNGDDDMIGVVIASSLRDNKPIHILAVRTAGGMNPYWAIMVCRNTANNPGVSTPDPDVVILADGSNKPGIREGLKTNNANNGWAATGPIRIWVEREGNKIKAWTSQANDATLTRDENTYLEADIGPEWPEFFNQNNPYGYVCQSQQNSTYSNIVMEGGLNQTVVWDIRTNEPEKYEYTNNVWSQTSGSIWQELGENTQTFNPRTNKTFQLYKIANNQTASRKQ